MKIKKLVMLFLGTILLICTGYPSRGDADVNINIGINVPPPAYVISAPPAVALIPGTYVYFIPGIEADIIFYHGYWYRPYKGHWHRAKSYNGPWVYLVPARVPHILLNLPPDFRHVPPGHKRIPYGQLKNNWKKWEKEKYWDKGIKEKKRVYKKSNEKGNGKGKGKH